MGESRIGLRDVTVSSSARWPWAAGMLWWAGLMVAFGPSAVITTGDSGLEERRITVLSRLRYAPLVAIPWAAVGLFAGAVVSAVPGPWVPAAAGLGAITGGAYSAATSPFDGWLTITMPLCCLDEACLARMRRVLTVGGSWPGTGVARRTQRPNPPLHLTPAAGRFLRYVAHRAAGAGDRVVRPFCTMRKRRRVWLLLAVLLLAVGVLAWRGRTAWTPAVAAIPRAKTDRSTDLPLDLRQMWETGPMEWVADSSSPRDNLASTDRPIHAASRVFNTVEWDRKHQGGDRHSWRSRVVERQHLQFPVLASPTRGAGVPLRHRRVWVAVQCSVRVERPSDRGRAALDTLNWAEPFAAADRGHPRNWECSVT